MIWVRDKTARFAHRPHFEPKELEDEAWRALADFHRSKYSRPFEPPWKTDDLSCLIEERAESLDLYADLRAREGPDVEGVTVFRRGKKPMVEVDASLTSDPRRVNRLRMTLAHEFMHVLLHGPLWEVHWDANAGPSLFSGASDNSELKSLTYRSDSRRPGVDWMEWQASHGAGALLAPARLVSPAFASAVNELGADSPTFEDSEEASSLISTISNMFKVSQDAAAVRLRELELLRPAAERDQGSLKFTDP